MTDDTTPHILQTIQTGIVELKQHATTTNRSIGNLANSILQLRTLIESHGTDIHTMALAVGENAARLTAVDGRLTSFQEHVEARFAEVDAQLAAIRSRLPQ